MTRAQGLSDTRTHILATYKRNYLACQVSECKATVPTHGNQNSCVLLGLSAAILLPSSPDKMPSEATETVPAPEQEPRAETGSGTEAELQGQDSFHTGSHTVSSLGAAADTQRSSQESRSEGEVQKAESSWSTGQVIAAARITSQKSKKTLRQPQTDVYRSPTSDA